jgi:hypothetical protein
MSVALGIVVGPQLGPDILARPQPAMAAPPPVNERRPTEQDSYRHDNNEDDAHLGLPRSEGTSL